jgi:WD40 repeat protein
VAFALVATVAACDGGGEQESAPSVATEASQLPTPVERSGELDQAPPGGQAVVELPPVERSGVVTATITALSLSDGSPVYPGPWAPDGSALVAFVGVGRDADGNEILRVQTVDASDPNAVELSWDSGDVQDSAVHVKGLAAWDADGNLVLPRSDGMRVDEDGNPLSVGGVIDGQVREVVIAPDGRSVFAFGPDGAWVIDGSGRVRPALVSPDSNIEAASWRQDSAAVAVAERGGAYFVIDAASGSVQPLAVAAPVPGLDHMPAPRWLGDGTVLLSAATEVRTPGGRGLDHLLADPQGERGTTVSARLGLEPSPAAPLDASGLVSNDGEWLVYPELEFSGEVNTFEHTASWLLGARRGETISTAPLTDPVWSPDASRIAYLDDGGLSVWHVAQGARRSLVPAGSGVHSQQWSPDGRWISYGDDADTLWVVASDGRAGPKPLLERVTWVVSPTWSDAGDRLAANFVSEPPQTALGVVYLGIDEG